MVTEAQSWEMFNIDDYVWCIGHHKIQCVSVLSISVPCWECYVLLKEGVNKEFADMILVFGGGGRSPVDFWIIKISCY